MLFRSGCDFGVQGICSLARVYLYSAILVGDDRGVACGSCDGSGDAWAYGIFFTVPSLSCFVKFRFYLTAGGGIMYTLIKRGDFKGWGNDESNI